ncbi:MAG: glycerate kinase [Treponema sp.]|jgi:hydroxypyruvate reductase|nr:glycerate kinase [Treponema sp.]
MKTLYQDAKTLIDRVIQANMPQQAVRNALTNKSFSGNIYLIAIGKAAWTMAHSAWEELGDRIKHGIVITKYDHSLGDIPGMEIIEAGHPLSDENTIAATRKAVEMARSLGAGDELLFLISGGGSALFEQPLPGLTLADIVDINSQLLASGADIVEINMIRKRLSTVKAGRFALLCAPARVFIVVLSDVLGDRLDSIASGPAAPDMSTADEVTAVVRKYHIIVNDTVKEYLGKETPKSLDNVETVITGSVRTLCSSAADIAASLGYAPHVLCSEMNCEAREAGRLISAIARQIDSGDCAFKRPCAVILGGETVVNLKGKGSGGRNQELALAAAEGITGIENLIVFSFGSDGTDGPTDAAGGIVDGSTAGRLKEKGLKLRDFLDNNDSYSALSATDGLIRTGPTGTNVNDVAVILCR